MASTSSERTPRVHRSLKKGGFISAEERCFPELNERCALVLIDMQEGLSASARPGRNNIYAEEQASLLLRVWRERKLPVVHVYHTSVELGSRLRPEHPGHKINSLLTPIEGELTIEKHVNSGFGGRPSLAEELDARGVYDLVICGLTSEHCVSTTVRVAANSGFHVWLVPDCCAAFDTLDPFSDPGEMVSGEVLHRASMVSLKGEFCFLAASRELELSYFRVWEAREFVREAHAEHVQHLDRVADVLLRHFQRRLLTSDGEAADLSVVFAGFCLDLVDHAKLTSAEVAARFGANTAALVAQLTDDRSLPPADRKRRQLEQAGSLTVEAQAVRLADLIVRIEQLQLKESVQELAAFASWTRTVVKQLAKDEPALQGLLTRLASRIADQPGQEEDQALLQQYLASSD